MYPMGNIAVKPDFRLRMSSNPRPYQKQGVWELSELVERPLYAQRAADLLVRLLASEGKPRS